MLRWPIESIGFLLSMTFDTRTAIDRFFEVLDEENTITDPETPKHIAKPDGAARRSTTCTSATRTRPPQFPDLLDGIDLELEPGETMALVGLTGSGKTTLTALATRLYDVTGGAVRLDGVDVRDLTREELRRHIAMAFEDATLFSASVRDNVLLGRPELADGGPEADAVLDEALEIAQADFVADLPEGADTRGRRGGALALRRTAAAPRARARGRREARRARARRPAVGARRRHRGARRGRAAPRARHDDGARRRAPAVDGACSPTGSPCSRTAASPRSARTPSCSRPTSTTASSSRRSTTIAADRRREEVTA